MKKKLISAAVMAAIGAPPMMMDAQADGVVLYGKFRQELHYGNDKTAGGTSGLRLDDSGTMSRLGVKVTKDLGNDLTAIGVWESIIELCGNAGGSNGSNAGCRQDFGVERQQFIGLQGAFGRVAFGRFNGSYKTYGGVKYDPFVATSLQLRGRGGMGQGPFMSNAFMDDVLEYQSPKLGDMAQFQIQWGMDDQQNPSGAGDSKNDINIGLKIGQEMWEIIGAYSKDKNDTGLANADTGAPRCLGAASPNGFSCDNWKLGGKVKFGSFALNGQYEKVESGNDGKGKFWNLAGVYKVGKFDLIGTYGNFSADTLSPAELAAGGANGTDGNTWALGAKYHMGKKTYLYTGYSQAKKDAVGGLRPLDRRDFALGMHMDF